MSEADTSLPGAGFRADPRDTSRTKMDKRVVHKDDGRILIYYTFNRGAEKERQQSSNQATEGAKK